MKNWSGPLTLVERLDALSKNQKVMLPQHYHAEYFYISEDDEFCSSTGNEVDDETKALILDDCTICWVTLEHTFTKDCKEAYEEYHSADAVDEYYDELHTTQGEEPF